jgi:hypothetical protein
VARARGHRRGTLTEGGGGRSSHCPRRVGAARNAAQIFWAVRGRSTWVTPRGASASGTALAMEGVEPMVAASPMPLTPSAVRGESVGVWSFSKADSRVAGPGRTIRSAVARMSVDEFLARFPEVRHDLRDEPALQ